MTLDLREIDRLVAEKVMGRDLYQIPWNAQPKEVQDRLPHYSTDIAAALEVVEKSENPTGLMPYPTSGLGDWYGGFGVHRMPEGGWRAGHLIGYPWEGEHFVAEFSARADTAPLAICLAALRAVGCEVPE